MMKKKTVDFAVVLNSMYVYVNIYSNKKLTYCLIDLVIFI